MNGRGEWAMPHFMTIESYGYHGGSPDEDAEEVMARRLDVSLDGIVRGSRLGCLVSESGYGGSARWELRIRETMA